MNRLNRQEQELVLDFYFHCGQAEDITRGRDLIATNPEAARLYAKLEDSLVDLDQIKYEPCPENLVDLTIARLKLAASARTAPQSHSRLQELLKQEQAVYADAAASPESAGQPVESRTPAVFKLHHRVGEFLATAAAILLILGILFPSAGFMRQHYYKVTCADNLRQMGQAFSAFAADHNDRLGEPVIQAGSPWWKIGDQGTESHSNTRFPWKLVKDGYVKGNVFVCRGSFADPLVFDPAQMSTLRDFPSRKNISYSFILFSDKNTNALQHRRKIIAGDQNPVFQQIPDGQNIYSKLNEFEKILLNEQLRQMLSSSHNCKGQNILSCDGSVEWVSVRTINDDDIYTIRGVNTYTGREIPIDMNDIFLAP